MNSSQQLGLVLSGGGARGAYQVGVLRGIADLLPAGKPFPFRVVTGVSTGAVNAAAIASFADDFENAVERLWQTWAHLRVDDVFRSNALSIAAVAARWIRDLALGGALGDVSSTHLVDTTPLRRLLEHDIDFERIHAHVTEGRMHAVAVSATDYGSGTVVTFFDAHAGVQEWARTARVGTRTVLGLPHVMASSAIPFFFPPEPIANSFWGDGCIRLLTPLSPAIRLGADRILAIGVGHARTEAELRTPAGHALPRVTPVDIAQVVLNSVFLDSLGGDIERMQRVNRTLAILSPSAGGRSPEGLRSIPILSIQPSEEPGALAATTFAALPRTLRYMLRGLGASEEKGGELLSYLAFDSAYTERLLELGRADAHAKKEQILALTAGGES